MKPGIQCRLWNYKANGPWGGYEIGTIYPYNLVSIRTESISRQIGMMDHFIMKEVDRAISFFLGLSDEVPEFLADKEEVYDVYFTQMDQEIDCTQKMNRDYTLTFSSMVVPEVHDEQPEQKTEESESSVEQLTEETKPNKPNPETIKEIPDVPEEGQNELKGKCFSPTIRAEKRESLIRRYIPQLSDEQMQIAYKHIGSESALFAAAFMEKYLIFSPDEITTSKILYQYYQKVYEAEGWANMPTNQGFGRSLNSALKAFHGDQIKIVSMSDLNPSKKHITGVKINTDLVNRVLGCTETEVHDEQVSEVKPDQKPEKIVLPDNVDDEVRTFANSRMSIDPTLILPYNHQNAEKIIGLKAMCTILSRRVPIEAVALKYGLTMNQALQFRSELERYVFKETESILSLDRNPNKFSKQHNLYKIALAIMLEFGIFNPGSNKSRVQFNQITFSIRTAYKMNFSDDAIWSERYYA